MKQSSYAVKVEYWLAKATSELEKAGVGSARLDSLIILEDILGKDRAHVLAHPELELSKTRLKRLNSRLKKRGKHLPMAYIRGWTEFYGRKFKVNRHVLEPRPESETMIDLLKKLPLTKKATIADIGTGCGALGISAALELHTRKVDLYDIDGHALAVARHNLAMHELDLKVYRRDLLHQAPRGYDVILANLPYVPNNHYINQAAEMEPRIAIRGGSDGLDVYRRMFEQLAKSKHKPTFVLTESLPPQHEQLETIATSAGFRLRKTEDLIQLFSAH